MRRAAKVDRNQAEIVEALRRIGCSVQLLHTVGGGCPDLAVGKSGRTVFLEVKDGTKPPSARRLTDEQMIWHGSWTGGPVAVVCDVESAIRAVVSVT